MKKEIKYVNVYQDAETAELWTGQTYPSEEEAVDNIGKENSSLVFVKTLEVEILTDLESDDESTYL